MRWADSVNAERDRALEFEEILGYHLEQAYRYLCELRAARRKAAWQSAAMRRGGSSAGQTCRRAWRDHAAVNLLRRAAALLPIDDPQRVERLPEWGEALMRLGEFAGARAVLEEAYAVADRISNHRVKAASRIASMLVGLHSGEADDDWSAQTLETTRALILLLERESAHDELALAWRAIVLAHGVGGRYRLMSEAAERSTAHARLRGKRMAGREKQHGVVVDCPLRRDAGAAGYRPV